MQGASPPDGRTVGERRASPKREKPRRRKKPRKASRGAGAPHRTPSDAPGSNSPARPEDAVQAGVSARNFRARWGESRPRMHRRPCRPRALSVRLQARRRECGSRATLSRHAAVSMHLRGLNPSRRCLNPAEAFAGRRFRSVSLPCARIRKRRDGFRTNGRRAERTDAKDRGRSGIIGRASARNSERALQGRRKRAQTDPCGSSARNFEVRRAGTFLFRKRPDVFARLCARWPHRTIRSASRSFGTPSAGWANEKNFTFRATEAGCRPASVLAAAAARAASSRFGNSPRLLRRFDRLEKTFSARPFARLPAGEQARGRAPSAPIHARMRERVNPPPRSPRRTRALSFLPCRT